MHGTIARRAKSSGVPENLNLLGSLLWDLGSELTSSKFHDK